MARKTVVLAAALAFLQAIVAAPVQRFHLSQASVRLPEVKAYVDILDAEGNAISDSKSVGVSGTFGGRSLRFTSLTPFENAHEGVAYIFVVDTSESIESARFDEIRSAVTEWMRELDAKDRAALLAFAEKVHVLSDFTDSREKALAAARSLTRNGKKSLIHRALTDAIGISSRKDSGLPARRAVVIVSDGKDEGSGLTSDDVLDRAIESHVPVYAIGYSNLQSQERRQYLDQLHRIAEKSGGDYEESGPRDLTTAFAAIKKSVRRVFVAAFSCPGCVADAKKQRLELRVDAGPRSFSESADVLAVSAPAAARAPWWKRLWWVYAAAGLVLAGIALVVWRWRRKKEPDSLAVPVPDFPEALPNPDMPTGRVPVERTEPSIRLRFTVIRGRGRGKVSEVRLNLGAASKSDSVAPGARLVIGRRPACDLALADDETVSSEHCEIVCVNDKLVIRDLQSSNGTFVNGVPVVGDRPLETGDRVGIGQTEYRVGVVSDPA